jgi:hypothetical protein
MPQVVHQFTSPKPDGADATLVRPSNWNAQHTVTYQIDVISGAGSIALTDDVVRLQAGTYAVTVPLATGSGKQIYVFQDGAGTMTLTPSGVDTIGGQTSVPLSSTGSSCIICDETPGTWGLVESTSGSAGVLARLAGMIWPHGWPVDSNGNPLVSLSYNAGTRQVTITANSGSSFTVWWRGVPTTIASPYTTTAHGAVEGGWFLSWNGTAFTWSQSVWDFYAVNPTTYVYYSSLLSTGAAFSELHRWGTDPGYHQDIHFAIGTSLQSGGQLSGYTLNTFTDAALQFSVAQTTINDEDINYVLGPAASGSYTVWYRSGVNGYWEWQSGLSFPFIYSAGAYADINTFSGGSWGLTSLSGFPNSYGTAYVVTTPALAASNQFIIIPGQTQYTTLAAAQAETFNILSLGAIPWIEFVAIAQIVFHAEFGGGGTTNTSIAAVAALTGSRSSITLPISNNTTLALAYSNGSTSAQQTMSLLDTKGGGIVVNGTEVGFTGASAFQVQGANSSVVDFPTPGGLTVTTGAIAGSTPTAFAVTGGAYTIMTTGTEDNDVLLNLSATKTWASSSFSLQRDVLVKPRTYAFSGGTGTITTGVTLAVAGAPTAGSGATITNPFAFGVQAGSSFFNGEVGVGYNGTTLPNSGGSVALAISAPYQSPPSAGATQGFLNLAATGGGSGNLSVGIDSLSDAWIQSQNAASTTSYPLFLNPNGGCVCVNTTTHGVNSFLQVGGSISTASVSTWNAMNVSGLSLSYTGSGASPTSIRTIYFSAPSISSTTNPLSITNMSTVSIAGPPNVGTNTTVTNLYSLWVEAGNTMLGGLLAVAPPALASTTPTALTVTGGAYTAMSTTVEDVDVNINLSATKTWATGAIATQRDVLIQARTYAFAGASTVTNAATLAVTNAPTAGANATITNPWALWVQAGATVLGANVLINTTGPASAFVLPSTSLEVVTGTAYSGSASGNSQYPGAVKVTANASIGYEQAGNGFEIQCENNYLGGGQGSGIKLYAESSDRFGGIAIRCGNSTWSGCITFSYKYGNMAVGSAFGFSAISTIGLAVGSPAQGSLYPITAAAGSIWNNLTFIGDLYVYAGATITSLSYCNFGSTNGINVHAGLTGAVTVSDFYTVNIQAGVPLSSTTFTRNWSLYSQGNSLFGGGIAISGTSINSAGPYAVLATDCKLEVAYTTTAAITLDLPQISTLGTVGRKVLFIIDSGNNAATHNITVTAYSTDTINNSAAGGSAVIMTNGGALCLLSDPTSNNWEVFSVVNNNPGAVSGTNLGNASVTINPGSDNASFYSMPAGTLGANQVITLGVTGTLYAGASTVWIQRRDVSAYTLTIQNGGTNGTSVPSIVLPASPPRPMLVGATYDGSDWYIHTVIYVQ